MRKIPLLLFISLVIFCFTGSLGNSFQTNSNSANYSLNKITGTPTGSINFPHEIVPNSILYLTLVVQDTNKDWITFSNSESLNAVQTAPQQINNQTYNITVNTYILKSGTWNYNITLLGNNSNNYLLGSFQIITPFDAIIQDYIVPISMILTVLAVIIFVVKHLPFFKK